MSGFAQLDAAGLLARANEGISENDIGCMLLRCAEIVGNPSLALLLRVLADVPPEIAALYSGDLDQLASRLHPDTDGPTIARAAARAVAQFAE